MISPHPHDYHFITLIKKILLNYYMIVTERITKFPWNFLFLPFSFGNEAYYKVIGKKKYAKKVHNLPKGVQ